MNLLEEETMKLKQNIQFNADITSEYDVVAEHIKKQHDELSESGELFVPGNSITTPMIVAACVNKLSYDLDQNLIPTAKLVEYGKSHQAATKMQETGLHTFIQSETATTISLIASQLLVSHSEIKEYIISRQRISNKAIASIAIYHAYDSIREPATLNQ